MALGSITPAVLAYRPPHPRLEEFVPDCDRAHFADPKKAQLLAAASAVEDVSPYIGTELKGLQISRFTDAQKDELALLVAEVHEMNKRYKEREQYVDGYREAWSSFATRISHSSSSMSSRHTMAKSVDLGSRSLMSIDIVRSKIEIQISKIRSM